MNELKKAPIENEVDIQEQHPETAPETRKGFLVWVKTQKTQLFLIGVSIPTIVAVVLGLKNKEAIKALWNQLNEEIKKANMYSSKWFETVTDAQQDLMIITDCETFIRGFQIGAKIMLDVLTEGEVKEL